MTDSSHGMVQQHPRAGVAHDLTDSCGHSRGIAVDGAFAAASLLIAERTAVEAPAGIVEKFPAFGAERATVTVTVAVAIHTYHHFHYALLAVDLIHRERVLKKADRPPGNGGLSVNEFSYQNSFSGYSPDA